MSEFQQDVEKVLKSFSFVVWDRFVTDRKSWAFYGWMEREDNYKDFLVLEFSKTSTGGLDIHFITSSAKHDPEIKKLLGIKEEDTNKCKRVEKFFNIGNMVRLGKKKKL